MRDSREKKNYNNYRLFYFSHNADSPFIPHIEGLNACISYPISDAHCTTNGKDKEKPAGMLHDISLIPTVSYV